jgi:glycosyltransferase involved in cell wall biosynthesis
MKIAFFDNLANNAYGLTKIFRKQGYYADLLLDASDTFPISQPIWEDCDFTIDTDLLENKSLTHKYWGEKNFELHWERPPWIKETMRRRRRTVLLELFRHPFMHYQLIRTAIEHRSLFPCSFEEIKNIMKSYDLVIAFGLGSIYAHSANVPFMHYPYGGDLTIIPFQKSSVGLLQRRAFEQAKYIIVGDPYFFDFLKKLGIESKAKFIPFMIDIEIYKQINRDEAMDILESDIVNKIRNKFIFFVPSRQDFYWKGSDKIIIALSRLLKKTRDVFAILSGWGNDLEQSKQMVNQLNLGEHIIFLPYIMSKKRLVTFYNLADVVMDQFNLGGYGTSTMEALACGKPVIANIETSRYNPYFRELPPVLRAESAEQIYCQMLKLWENKGGLCEEIGRKSREWIMEFHGIKNNFHKIIQLCEECRGSSESMTISHP